ncbi:hypothetical protein [uncultured Brachyspira sp.]|uniref:hypothetical protein n=1 Tax=uncultured Brachyspira sp. TaxID=221953 RepID=UPI002629D7FD|nr:hypothetical protein [uncultured Brachyspira sp.]
MNNNKLFSFKKELLRASVYGVIAIAFADLIFFSIYNNNQIYITIILIILEIITIVFLYLDASSINKRKLIFIKNNSQLEHILNKNVTKDNIIDRLRYFGYSMYSINSSRVFINADVIKNKKSITIHAYYFFLADIDKDGEGILNNIKNEANEIFDLYIDDNQKLFRKNDNDDKDKILKAKLYNHAVFIFYGNNVPNRLIAMSEYGYTKEKLLNANAQIFTVSYLPSENNLYFAEAIENVINISKFPKNDFVYIIKDIFSL